MVKAVIFDMDGTALDSMGRGTRNITNYIKSLGIELTEEESDGLNGLAWEETVHYLNELKDTNFCPKAFLDGVLEVHYGLYRDTYELMPGFLEFIDYLDERGISYAIATATRLYGAQDVFERFGLMDRFEFIITEGIVGYTKNYPNIYLEAAKRMGADTSNTIVFEDALYAVKTAKEAGFQTIALKEPFYIEDREEVIKISDLAINDFTELMEMIENEEIKI